MAAQQSTNLIVTPFGPSASGACETRGSARELRTLQRVRAARQSRTSQRLRAKVCILDCGATIVAADGDQHPIRVHPKDRASLADACRTALLDHQNLSLEVRLALPRHGWRWFTLTAQPDGEAGRSACRLSGACIELPPRKASARACRESEKVLRKAVDLCPASIWMITPQGEVLPLNRVARATPVSRVAPDRSQHLEKDWQRCIHPDDRAQCMATVARALARQSGFRHEHRFLGADRAWRSVVSSARPQWSEDGQFAGLVGVSVDRTPSSTATQAPPRAGEQAAEVPATQAAFLANVSHEVLTPLHAILAMSDLLLRAPLALEQRERMEIVEASARSLLSMATDILDFTSLTARRIELDHSDFELQPVLEDVRHHLLHQARDKGVNLNLTVTEALRASLRGDPARLRQVICNLGANAIKFSDRGDVNLTVEILAEDSSTVVLRFTVADTGSGIALEMQPRLFSPFQLEDDSATRRHGGIGLSLSISRHLVELMGGEIGFESAVGNGTTFWFTARFGKCGPAPTSHMATAPPESSPLAPDSSPTSTPIARILLAEDNRINQKVALAMLRTLGHQVDVVANGREALEALQRNRYELLLLDCHMPVMSGYQAAAIIRSGSLPGVAPEIPIVAVTASTFATGRRECLDAGMDDCVAKPLRTADLENVINKWLNRSPRIPC